MTDASIDEVRHLRLVTERLLRDERRDEVLEEAARADEQTKSRWRRAAERLAASLTPATLERSTEPSLQGAFLDALFVRLLGYSGAMSGVRPFTLSEHITTEIDATEADGLLGWFATPGAGQAISVIELKGARTNLEKRQLSRADRLTPVDQAFLYATKFQGCEWVIVSNFVEIRLYSTRHGQRLYERFEILELQNEKRLLEFVSLFQPHALIGPRPDSPGYLGSYLVERPALRDRDITERFYEHYANERNRLLQHFLEQDIEASPSEVIAATQTLLDRILFICFAEDTRTLLPLNILQDTADVAERSRSRSQTKVWDELRELFRDIDEGRVDVSPTIPGYNGGLFARNELLDERLLLSDSLALELVGLARWDYRHSLNVEVLGHIFEQSIADLESLHRLHSLDIDAVEADARAIADTRRARGVYYTPRWVTEYIAETTIGYVAEPLNFDPKRLSELSILDPACGSGAFLAQGYRYLLDVVAAHVAETLPGEQPTLDTLMLPSSYLRCLSGIDIMPEAVEIARLSLWLASANPSERLLSLETIREGNTLAPGAENAIGLPQPDMFTTAGFDVCFGNPPWGADMDYEVDSSLELARGQVDSYELFVERTVRDFLRPGGAFGFVVPDRLLRPEGERLRRWLFDNFQVREVLRLGEGVFPGVFRSAVILILVKESPLPDDKIRTLVVLRPDRDLLEDAGSTHLRSLAAERGGFVSRSRVVDDEAYDIPLVATDEDLSVMSTMHHSTVPWTGKDGIFEPYGRGVELGTDGFVIRCNSCFTWQVGPRRRSRARGGGYEEKVCDSCRARLAEADWHEHARIILDAQPSGDSPKGGLPGSGWQRLYFGEDVSRYHLGKPKWIRLGVENVSYKEASLYSPPKLLIRQTGVGVNVAVDETDAMCLQSVYVYRVRQGLDISPYYLLACLASRAMLFYFHRLTNQVEWQSFPRLVHRTLQRLPLPDPGLETRAGRLLHDSIVDKARQRMQLPAVAGHELDLEIEALVMKAYSLEPTQRQRIIRTLQSVQRLRVIREMFPESEAGVPLAVPLSAD